MSVTCAKTNIRRRFIFGGKKDVQRCKSALIPLEESSDNPPGPSVARLSRLGLPSSGGRTAGMGMLPPSAASAAVWMDAANQLSSARLEPSRTCATSRARTHALLLARSRRVTRVAMSSLARRSPWQPLCSDLNMVLLNTKKEKKKKKLQMLIASVSSARAKNRY